MEYRVPRTGHTTTIVLLYQNKFCNIVRSTEASGIAFSRSV